MKYIAHRGNINGVNKNLENSPDYINEALSNDFEVEIDVWMIDGLLFLGHDEPQYEITQDWLNDRCSKLWIHCKNIEAIEWFSDNDAFNWFWHETDTITLTSKGFIWAYPGNQPIQNSIAVLPEINNEDTSQSIGICSDYISIYKNEMLKNFHFLFYTYENNQALAELSLKHFFKHNKSKDLKVTLVSNNFKNTNFQFPDKVNYLSAEVDMYDSNRFVKTMIHALLSIKEDYVFFMLDDYFFLKEIKYHDLDYILNLMKCENIDYFGFDDIGGSPLSDFPKFESECFNKFNDNLYHRFRGYRYVYSVQPCIWKKDSLIKLFERCDNITLHDLDETRASILEKTQEFKSTMTTLKSLFDYNVVDETISNYFVIAYTEICRHGVFNLPENGQVCNPHEFVKKFTYKLIDEEELHDNPDFAHILYNYKRKTKINCYLDLSPVPDSCIVVNQKIVENLKLKYPQVEFNIIHSITMHASSGYTGPACKFGPYFLILENPYNKKYFTVSYYDKMVDIPITGTWDLENCVELFSSIGNHVNDLYYKEQDKVKFTPISYVHSKSTGDVVIDEIYHNRISILEDKEYNRSIRKNIHGRIYPETLTFRGFLYAFREYLYSDNRFKLYGNYKKMDSNNNLIIIEDTYVGINDFYNEIDKYAVNLSLNGAGEICYRDIEILGLGTALFRFKLVNKFHNPLIPNYHYISVDFDDIPTDLESNEYYSKLADRMYDRWLEVKDDFDFIDFVAQNGRKWYEENGTTEMNARIATNLIDIYKLI